MRTTKRPPSTQIRRGGRAAAALLPLVLPLLLLLVTAPPVVGQPTLDRVMTDFEAADYALEVEGATAPEAEVYYSRGAGAFLVLSERLPSPVLLRPRTAEVESVWSEKVSRRSDGTIDLLPDAVAASHGRFQLDGNAVGFTVDGVRAVISEKPYLLGSQSAEDVADYSREYAAAAERYEPSEPILDELRAVGEPVEVVVYFGSWCPACKQMVPRILRVADELAGSPVDFEFYGLPRPFSGEPRAEEAGITGVPTGIVYRDGREVERLSGNDWKIPELAIREALGG